MNATEMKELDQRPLTVYKASAGSGKTFTLAVEYIKLLIRDPQNYRYILAVTFTNKATQEMKMRILSKLYGIAHGLPDSTDYLTEISKAFPQYNERVIRSRAEQALTELVHNFNYFRVETIDSFFQRVLRNLARELDLTANLQVVLNDYEVESLAVDNLIEQINNDDDPLLKWIMEFVRERMDDNKNWNVIGQIKTFGTNIFSDFYKSHQSQLKAIIDDESFFRHYKSQLVKTREAANNRMKAFASRYAVIADAYDLTDDCYSHGSSNVPGYFANLGKGNFLGEKTKMPNSYVAKGLEDPAALLKKSTMGTAKGDAIINEVGPLLSEAEEARKQAVVEVVSVNLTLQHVNELRLLGRIEKEVSNINKENNDYLLSNTQSLLNALIDKQDSPFIYEKIGGQLRYIMIDEFQDTSIVQWKNFEVLLNDCISHDRGSLIVGDVKQSIYRWRDGDWHQLQNLDESRYEFLHNKSLKVNYRSVDNIVNFNNFFFTVAAMKVTENAKNELDDKATEDLRKEVDAIGTAYEEVAQEVGKKTTDEGLVEVTLLPKDDYDNKMIASVQSIIERLLSKGIPQNKIAIIVRKNRHIKFLADYFLHHAVMVNDRPLMLSMVSDEAFRLDASLAVNVIVKAMYLLIHPDDKLTQAYLVKAYHKILHIDCEDAADHHSDAELFIRDENSPLEELLPIDLTAKRSELQSLPLIDLAERLHRVFHLDKLTGQSAYVCAFFDQLANFLSNHLAGIDEFLREWDDKLCSKSIHSDDVNGIRLITIHKSKGLEMDNVIIPYCDWAIEDIRDLMWVEPKVKPFNELPLVPLNLQSARLKKSIYCNDYQREHVKSLMDNLNLLYVAFTRASRNLFIIGKNKGAKAPSQLIKEVITQYDEMGTASAGGSGDSISILRQKLAAMLADDRSSNLKAALAMAIDNDDKDEAFHFSFGKLSLSKTPKKNEETSNIFEQQESGIKVKIESNLSKATFLQSNDSKAFMTPDDELEEQHSSDAYIKTGNVIHALFASIHNYDEIDKAVDQLEFDGVLYERPMTREQLNDYIKKKLSNKQIKDWFSSKWKVFTECSILDYDEDAGIIKESRPDRVIYDGREMIVIDFKTGREKNEHRDQVRRYVRLLQDMGYNNVSGYLWYIHHDNVVKVC